MNDQDASRQHTRGSAVLLVGRFVALGLNFGVQVLTVRYLAKSDYGAFAYAMAVVSMATSLTLLGFDHALARFVALYQEQRDYPHMFGAIVVALGFVTAAGLAFVGAVVGLQNALGQHVVSDPQALTVLVTVAALGPMMAIEAVFQSLLTVFARPSAIFFRRHVVGPLIKLSAVGFAIAMGGDVHTLAVAYVIGGCVGIAIYLVMMVRLLADLELPPDFHWRDIRLPTREMLMFSLPLLTTSFFIMFQDSIASVFLESTHGTTAVAAVRAIVPVAGLNLVVLQSFAFLFTPAATRLYARGDDAGIANAYRQSALWIAVLSFPAFAITGVLAEPLSVLLFGERYASSGPLLGVLALGTYVHACFGFNFHTLRIYGKVRYVAIGDLLTILTGLLLCVLLIPPYGALGAAISSGGMLAAYKIIHHIGMRMGTGITLFERPYRIAYSRVVLAAAILFSAQYAFEPPVAVSIAGVAIISAGLLFANRRTLDVAVTFPELLRVPVLGRLLAY